VKVSEGASGAFIYYTKDQTMLVKTCDRAELKVLLDMLPSYYAYLRDHPGSRLCRFLGAFSLKLYTLDIHFVVMTNVFNPNFRAGKIHAVYDLKGSWVNRNSPSEMKLKRSQATWTCQHCHEQFSREDQFKRCKARPFGGHKPGTTYKDNDLNFRLQLTPTLAEVLSEQLTRDATFLASQQIMDYSLLVGVHYSNFSRVPDPAESAAGGGGQYRVGSDGIALHNRTGGSATAGGGNAGLPPVGPSLDGGGHSASTWRRADSTIDPAGRGGGGGGRGGEGGGERHGRGSAASSFASSTSLSSSLSSPARHSAEMETKDAATAAAAAGLGGGISPGVSTVSGVGSNGGNGGRGSGRKSTLGGGVLPDSLPGPTGGVFKAAHVEGADEFHVSFGWKLNFPIN
jgi:hypothetical protein